MAGWLTSTEQITVCLACGYRISCDQLNMIKSKTKMHTQSFCLFTRFLIPSVRVLPALCCLYVCGKLVRFDLLSIVCVGGQLVVKLIIYI